MKGQRVGSCALVAGMTLATIPLAGDRAAAGQARERHAVEARRADRPPQIDGVLDDTAWGLAQVLDDFVQQEPSEGAPATERTEVRVLYDAAHLYIGVHASDAHPQGIIATEMRRDSPRLFEEDNFEVIIDTFRDSRSGYMFVTNPLGAKLEQQVFEEGEEGGRRGTTSNVNRNWDGVWDVAARRTPDGWDAEIVIPLVTLRFPVAAQQIWGINFMRNIRRKNEQVFWAPIPKAYGLTRVSQAGTVTGMSSLSRGLDLRVKPFVIAGGRRDRTGARVATTGLRDTGLDVKYGLSSGLSLDVTVNTDFAQAEVDDEQVNLTRFSLFFPEKRDFFLENSGQFNIGTQGRERMADLFFSRRIGLSTAGQPIPILGGARLTGKAARHNVALMDIQTGDAFGKPGENFFVARYSRDFLSRSKVGGLIVNKQAVEGGAFNRTFAADASLTPHRNVTVTSFLARTSTPGASGGDLAFHTRAAWLDRRWNIFGEYTDIQDNFNPEVGFVPRVGIRTTKVHLERNPRPGKYHIRVLEPMIDLTYTTDQNNRLLTRRLHQMLGMRLDNGAYIIVFFNKWFDQLDQRFAIRKDVTIPAGAYRYGEWQFLYTSNPSRRFYQLLQYSPQTFYGGTRVDTDAVLGVRATSQVAAEIQYRRNDVDLPWGAFVVNLGALRLDVALSPRMTVRTISQYNSSTHQVTTSVRYNFVYRPGSDLYVTYDELRGDMPGLPEVRNRQLALKLTYLLSR